MSLRQDWSRNPCPIARSLNVVGDPWIMLILREALLGARRYEQFRDRLKVADNVLSRRLSQLVDAGLLRRSPYRGTQRMHEEYLVTGAGADLLPVLDALARWGETHTRTPERYVEMLVRHRTCGQPSASPAVCDHCGEPMTAADRMYERRWLGPATPDDGTDTAGAPEEFTDGGPRR